MPRNHRCSVLLEACRVSWFSPASSALLLTPTALTFGRSFLTLIYRLLHAALVIPHRATIEALLEADLVARLIVVADSPDIMGGWSRWF